MTLGDALDGVLGGGTPARHVPEYWGGEIPWATVKDLKAPRLSSTEERITPAGLQSSSARLVPRGTVLLATRMAVGRVAWTDIDVAINQDLKALIAGAALHPRFLFHFMVANRARLESMGTGTTVNGIPLETVRELPLCLPSIQEQRGIAAVLDSIDEATQRAESAAATTQALRQVLLHEFITRGVPGWHTEWLHVPGLGTIPACWQVVPLGDLLLDIEAGSAPPRLNRPAVDDEWGVLRVGAVTWGEYRPTENKALAPGVLAETSLEVHVGDLLLSRANTPELVGRTVLVRTTPPRLLLSDKTLRLMPDPRKTDQAFLHAVLATAAARGQLTGAASGSSKSMFNVSQASIRKILVPFPPREEQRRIIGVGEALRETMDIEAVAQTKLRAVKNALSESLLAGHLRVVTSARAAAAT